METSRRLLLEYRGTIGPSDLLGPCLRCMQPEPPCPALQCRMRAIFSAFGSSFIAVHMLTVVTRVRSEAGRPGPVLTSTVSSPCSSVA